MSISLSPSQQALVEALARLPKETRAEIINGAIVPIARAGGIPSHISGLIFYALHQYASTIKHHYAFMGNAAFIVDLPNRGSFTPDAAFAKVPKLDENFIQGAPIVAVEVRNQEDYGVDVEQYIRQKIADYFAAGTTVVWDVDAMEEFVIRVYRATDPDNPKVYGSDDEAEAEPALPGWRVAVSEILPQDML